MNLLQEHNKKYQFFHDITGVAMKVYNKYRPVWTFLSTIILFWN